MAIQKFYFLNMVTFRSILKLTTFFQNFEDIKYNRDNLHVVDSTIGRMHQFSVVEKLDNKFQNLGTLGTALRPVFYTPPTEVGIHSGFDAYTPYYITSIYFAERDYDKVINY